MANSTRPKGPRKSKVDCPPKPSPDFPLYAHETGYWQRKINSKIHRFGRWGRIVNDVMVRLPGDGAAEALAKHDREYPFIKAGLDPREVLDGVKTVDGLTIGELCNKFLNAKLRKLEAGRMSGRSFKELQSVTDRIVSLGCKPTPSNLARNKNRLVASLNPDDFDNIRHSMEKDWGPVRVGKFVNAIRGVFNHALKNGWIKQPVVFGTEFVKPSATEMRKHRAAGAKRLFTQSEIHALLDAASKPLKAMILLGINCGFGNGDVADLPKSAIDFKKGWIDFPRPKTGVERRCKLWNETTEALKEALVVRPKALDKADDDCVFITSQGRRWSRTYTTRVKDSLGNEVPKIVLVDAVPQEFGKLLRKLKINGRKGLGFYASRHTFRTVADASRDLPSVRLIMGHADSSIDAVYREGIDDDRLEAVASHVHKWLFGSEGGAK